LVRISTPALPSLSLPEVELVETAYALANELAEAAAAASAPGDVTPVAASTSSYPVHVVSSDFVSTFLSDLEFVFSDLVGDHELVGLDTRPEFKLTIDPADLPYLKFGRYRVELSSSLLFRDLDTDPDRYDFEQFSIPLPTSILGPLLSELSFSTSFSDSTEYLFFTLSPSAEVEPPL